MSRPSTSPAGGEPRRETDARVAKALAHPLRARILERLGDRVASPAELAIELGVPVGVTSYHVRMLRQYGCVELVRTEPVRGALQHFYRAIALDRAQLDALSPALRSDLLGETVRAIVEDVRSAGSLSERGTLVSRTVLDLDPRAAQKLNRLLARTLKQTLDIARESDARGGGGEPMELALLYFRPPGQGSATTR